MASVLADLTAQIQALKAQQAANQPTFDALAAAATKVDNDVTALLAKITAPGVYPAELAQDIQELKDLTSAQAQGATALANVTSGLTAADAAANPTPAAAPATLPASGS